MHEITVGIKGPNLEIKWEKDEIESVPMTNARGSKGLTVSKGNTLWFDRGQLKRAVRNVTGKRWKSGEFSSPEELETFLRRCRIERLIEELLLRDVWDANQLKTEAGYRKYCEKHKFGGTVLIQLAARRLYEITHKDRHLKLVLEPLRPQLMKHNDKNLIADIQKLRSDAHKTLLIRVKSVGDTIKKWQAKYDELQAYGTNIANRNQPVKAQVEEVVSRILTPLRKTICHLTLLKAVPKLAAKQGALRTRVWEYNASMQRAKWSEEIEQAKTKGLLVEKDWNREIEEAKRNEFLVAKKGDLPELADSIAEVENDRQQLCRVDQKNWLLKTQLYLTHMGRVWLLDWLEVEAKRWECPVQQWHRLEGLKNNFVYRSDKKRFLLERHLYVTKEGEAWLRKWLEIETIDKQKLNQPKEVFADVQGKLRRMHLPSMEGLIWCAGTEELPQDEGLTVERVSARCVEDAASSLAIVHHLYPKSGMAMPLHASHGLLFHLASPYSRTWADVNRRPPLFNTVKKHLQPALLHSTDIATLLGQSANVSFAPLIPEEFLGWTYDFKMGMRVVQSQSIEALVKAVAANKNVNTVTAKRWVRKFELLEGPNTEKGGVSKRRAIVSVELEKKVVSKEDLHTLAKTPWRLFYGTPGTSLPSTNEIVRWAYSHGEDSNWLKTVWHKLPFLGEKNARHTLVHHLPFQLQSFELETTRNERDLRLAAPPLRWEALTQWIFRWDAPIRCGLSDVSQKQLDVLIKSLLTSRPTQGKLRQNRLHEMRPQDATIAELRKDWASWLPKAKEAKALWEFIGSTCPQVYRDKAKIATQLFPRLPLDRWNAFTERYKKASGLKRKSGWDLYWALYPRAKPIYDALQTNGDNYSLYRVSQHSLEELQARFNPKSTLLADLLKESGPIVRFKQRQ